MSESQTPPPAADAIPADENKLIAERREKLKALRAQGGAFPNDFRPDAFAGDLQGEYADAEHWSAEALAAAPRAVRVAGRLLAKRVMGKASFAQPAGRHRRIQLYLRADLGDAYEAFKGWDIGDIVGVEGTLTRTRTGELSVAVGAHPSADEVAAAAAGQVAWAGRRRAALPPALRRSDRQPTRRGAPSSCVRARSASSGSGSRRRRGASWKSKRR